MEINDKAWSILTEEERLALTLQLANGKSTWEAGEIMGKAHYKYLEIKQRAETFLRNFTVHFQVYGLLIPYEVEVSDTFKTYIQLIIGQRLSLQSTLDTIDNPSLSESQVRDSMISEAMDLLKSNPKPAYRDLMNLILDFDRWNNFRILPRNHQEPSAFKRRNKNRYRKQIKNLVSLNGIAAKILEKKFFDPQGTLYLPLLYSEYEEEKVIRIMESPTPLSKISYMGFYVFSNLNLAEEFIELLKTYNIYQLKSCKDGQKFWPQFRTLIKSSVNYEDVDNITPSRRFLETALTDLDDKKVSLLNKKKN